jgi:PKD repeat protein
MKKLVLTLLAGMFISLSAFAQNYTVTVFGTVMMVAENTISPVPGQEVIITIDSANYGFTYQNTVITDESGYFEDIIEIPGYNGYEYVQVMTYDSCLGQYQYNGALIIPGATLPSMDFFLCNTVMPECNAWFYYFQNNPADPYTFSFENMSMGNYTQVSWDFGDSTFSAEMNPVHTFPGAGTYYVCLTISDGMECYSTYCEFVNTNGGGNGCESFILPTNMVGLTVDFEGYTVSQYETEYTWEFGDGVTATGQFVSHTYPSPGMYTVFLQTIDAMGCAFQTFSQIWLDSTNQGSCSSYFYYEQSDSLTFTFSGVIYLNNGMIYPDSSATYFWDFGDGTTGSGQTITHTFGENPAGSYNVCLTATIVMPDGIACTSTYCEPVLPMANSFDIFGFVYLQNNLVADQAIVHLMSMDTTWQGVVEVQSATIDSGGYYHFADVQLLNSRFYFIQAELTQGSAYYGQYLPTYHISSLNWEEAMPILPLMNWTADVFMIAGSQMESGNGSITGTVTNLGARSFINGVEVVLMDGDNAPLIYTRSDEQGNFSFSQLAYGTYVIHAEIMGIHTIQAAVTLSEQQPEASVEVQVNGGEANVVFGVTEQYISLGKVGEVYPNPVNDKAKIDITVKEPVMVEISIFGQTGQLMNLEETYLNKGTNTLSLNTGSLPAGIYIVRVLTWQGEVVSRKFMTVQ